MAEPLPNGFVGNFPALSDDWGDDVNDNMRKWATLTQLSVESMSVRTPPPPVLNLVYIVPTNPYGVWSQFAKQIVFWNGSIYVRYNPSHGLLAYDRARDAYYKFVGDYPTGSWEPLLPDFVGGAGYLTTNLVLNTSARVETIPFSQFNITSGAGVFFDSLNWLEFTYGGYYHISLQATISGAANIIQQHQITGYIELKKPLTESVIVAQQLSVRSANAILHESVVKLNALIRIEAGDSVIFSARANKDYTLAANRLTAFTCHKVG